MTRHTSVPDLVAGGMTTREIADTLGVSYDAARIAICRRGLKATREIDRSVKDRVDTMPPEEAVDYLLACVECLLGVTALLDDEPLAFLTPAENKLFNALRNAAGRVATKESLLYAMCFGNVGDLPELKIVDVRVCHIRKKLPADMGRIETVWGVGYRFVESDQ